MIQGPKMARVTECCKRRVHGDWNFTVCSDCGEVTKTVEVLIIDAKPE